MLNRSCLFKVTAVALCVMGFVTESRSQQRATAGWRTAEAKSRSDPKAARDENVHLAAGQEDASARTRVTQGSSTLPNKHGQVWREYDIRPYTNRMTGVEKPEQAIVDWILRETGTDIWFSEPLGLLSGNRETIRVYHTREIQQTVKDVIDRFVARRPDDHALAARLITVGNANWRLMAQSMMRSVHVQTPGVEAWALSKEDAARLLVELRRRSEFREHNSPNVLIRNGQSHTIDRLSSQTYPQSVERTGDNWPGYRTKMGQVETGFRLTVAALLGESGRLCDAVVKYRVDQVERLIPLWVDVATTIDPRQRVQIQVPQTSSWQLHERFRWPVDEVLLISCGMVASPEPKKPLMLGGISPTLLTGPARADVLVMLEARRAGDRPSSQPKSARIGSLDYRGRY